jgi:hypothetical protein
MFDWLEQVCQAAGHAMQDWIVRGAEGGCVGVDCAHAERRLKRFGR